MRLLIPVSLAALSLAACATEPTTEPPMEDACQASAFQWLLQRPRADIPAALPTPNRVVADNQPVTMDYNPERLNIVWNHETGRVEHVRCG